MKRNNIVLLFASLFLISFWGYSQEKKPVLEPGKIDIGLEGMLGLSVGKNFYSVNVGGPALFLVLNKDWRIGVGALPSLYLLNGKLGARLGVAPRVDYKHLVIFAPFFHRDKTEEWIWSVGVGFKFHKK